jgi:uncharacterized protein YqfB (UPF0267 family)
MASFFMSQRADSHAMVAFTQCTHMHNAKSSTATHSQDSSCSHFQAGRVLQAVTDEAQKG